MLSYEKVIFQLVHDCVEEGKRRAQQLAMYGDFRYLKLFFMSSTESELGQLRLVHADEEPPSGFELACEDALSGAVPYDEYHRWVRARVMRLPILTPTLV